MLSVCQLDRALASELYPRTKGLRGQVSTLRSSGAKAGEVPANSTVSTNNRHSNKPPKQDALEQYRCIR